MLNPKEFCDLMAEATFCEPPHPNAWNGSAYRHHPCGILVDGILFVNEWNTNNYCSIQISSEGGWKLNQSKNPTGYGNPHPSPNGEAIILWANGRVYSTRVWEILNDKILRILEETAEYCNEAKTNKANLDAAKAKTVAEEKERTAIDAAIKLLS